MAIPDPHIDEMRLMTYEPKSRCCKRITLVPRRQDYIEVMWCLDYLPGLPQQWCITEFLRISQSPTQDVLATAVLRYLPEDTWDEEIHEEEFLENHGARRVEETNEEDRTGDSINRNPVTKWQPAVGPTNNSAPSIDEDWTFRKQTHVRTLNDSNYFETGGEAQKLEIRSIRSGYSSLAVEVEKIKKELIKQSQRLSGIKENVSDPGQCYSTGCVLQRLQHKLCLRMQVGVRSMSARTTRLGKRPSPESENTLHVGTGDGVHVGLIKARVECTLNQFESIARHMKTNANPGTIVFSPDFQHTQLPLQSRAAFRILFNSFIELTSQLKIVSLSDILEMARKCGTGRHGDILRLLGTYKDGIE